jgi:hypothetical protein
MLDEQQVNFICEDVKSVSLADLGRPNPVYYLCASPYVPDSYDNPDRLASWAWMKGHPARLFDAPLLGAHRALTRLLHWSTWRRRHQHRTRQCHYQRRQPQ